MAPSTASMCLRSESLAVYSCISARVCSRGGMSLLMVSIYEAEGAICREYATIAQQFSDAVQGGRSALWQPLQQQVGDIDGQLQHQQGAKHDREIDPQAPAGRQRPDVQQRSETNRQRLGDEIGDRMVVETQADHRPARPGRLVPRYPVEEHVREYHRCDYHRAGPVASESSVEGEPEQRE